MFHRSSTVQQQLDELRISLRRKDLLFEAKSPRFEDRFIRKLTWKAARSRGVLPVLSVVLTFAPWSRRVWTAETRPRTQAHPRAVSPSLSVASGSAPFSRNSSARLQWPSAAASMSAVRPARSRWSNSGSAWSRTRSVLLDKEPEFKNEESYTREKRLHWDLKNLRLRTLEKPLSGTPVSIPSC